MLFASSRELRLWYQNNTWFITLVVLVIIQFIVILNHWSARPEKTREEEVICPHFLVGDGENDAPTYVQEDRRYKKWEDNWDG